jgi:nucleotide-binding universal stress UspA family protein
VLCMATDPATTAGALGSVARAVLCAAPCPVVLVPPARAGSSWHLRHLLLPHDGTPATAGAFRPALQLAERADANLLVLHVTAARSGPPAQPGSFTVPRYVDQAHHEWPAWSREFLQRAGCGCQSDPLNRVRLALAVGEPPLEVLRVARDRHVDLIVIGWQGELEEQHAVTAKEIIRGTPCPLLFVRVDEGK